MGVRKLIEFIRIRITDRIANGPEFYLSFKFGHFVGGIFFALR